MPCRLILSGPFCTGKTSIIKVLSEKHQIPKLIDDTTRPMRAQERPGFPYNFIQEREFRERLDRNYYFETVTFNGYFYGVPRKSLEQDKWSLDILESSWGFYKDLPGVIGIYLEPPPIEVLVKRAQLRGDSTKHIEDRLLLLQNQSAISFPYHIPSQTTLEKSVEEIEKILRSKIIKQVI